jgi:Domain of unknown function (DUF5679)
VRKLLKLGLLAGLAAVAARVLRQQAPPEPAVGGQAPAPPPPAAPEPAADAVEGYCMKERKHVQIKDPQHTTAKNGREAVRGTCPDCGSTIFRFV